MFPNENIAVSDAEKKAENRINSIKRKILIAIFYKGKNKGGPLHRQIDYIIPLIKIYNKFCHYDNMFVVKKHIYIGTSGYNYQHWKGIFYPKNLTQSKWLQFYCQHFKIVELNVTFYRLPSKENFKSWHRKTPKDFKFVIKGSRYITHIKRLKSCHGPLKVFFANASALKEKLTCVLWQLPSSFKFDLKRLKDFIGIIKKKYSFCLHSFEFRHNSWFNEQTFSLLKENNINLCIADSPELKTPEVITSNFIYLRFHGGKILYESNYSKKELKMWAKKAKSCLRGKKLLLTFFNNDTQGFAIKNALEFREMLSEKL